MPMGGVELKQINMHPKNSTSLWVITRDFRGSLSAGNELCAVYKRSKTDAGFITLLI